MSNPAIFGLRPVPQMLAVIADFAKETFQAATLNQNILALLVKTMKDLKKHDGSHWLLLVPIARCVAHILATTKDEASVKPHVEVLCGILEQCLTNAKTLRQEHQISTAEQYKVLKGLMEELQYMIETKPRTKYFLLETLFEPMTNLIVSSFREEIHELTDVTRVLNSMMSCVSRNLRINIRRAHEPLIEEVVALLLSCGDYEVQQGLVELLLRLAPADERQAMGATWFHANIALINSFTKVGTKDFDSECRCFVNLLNSSLGVEARVITHPCETIIMGSVKVYKPKADGLKHLFADFNLGSVSLSFSFVRWDSRPNSQDNPVVSVRLSSSEVATASLLGLDERLLQLTLSLQHPLSQLENTDLANVMSLRLVFKRRYINIPRLLRSIYEGKIQIEESLLPSGSPVTPQLAGPIKLKKKKVSEGVSLELLEDSGNMSILSQNQSLCSQNVQSTPISSKKTRENRYGTNLPLHPCATLMSRHPRDIPPDVDSSPVSPSTGNLISEHYPTSPVTPIQHQQTQDTLKRSGGRPQTSGLLLNKLSCPLTSQISQQQNKCPQTPGQFLNKTNKRQTPKQVKKRESSPQTETHSQSPELNQKDSASLKQSVGAKVATPSVKGGKVYGTPFSKSPVEAAEPGGVQCANPETPSMQQQASLVTLQQSSPATISNEVVKSPVMVRKRIRNTQSSQLETVTDKMPSSQAVSSIGPPNLPENKKADTLNEGNCDLLDATSDQVTKIQDIIKPTAVDEVPSIQQDSTMEKPSSKLSLRLRSRTRQEKTQPIKPTNQTNLTLRSKIQQQKPQPKTKEVFPLNPVLNIENTAKNNSKIDKKVVKKKKETNVKDKKEDVKIEFNKEETENEIILETLTEPILSEPGKVSTTMNKSVQEQNEDKNTDLKTSSLEQCTKTNECKVDNIFKTYGKKKNTEKNRDPMKKSLSTIEPPVENFNTTDDQNLKLHLTPGDGANNALPKPSPINNNKMTMWDEFVGHTSALKENIQGTSADLVTPIQNANKLEVQLFQEAAPSKLRLSRPKISRASKRSLLPHLDFLQASSPAVATDPLTPRKRRLFNPDSSEVTVNTVKKSRKVTSSPPRTTKSQQGSVCTMEINQNFQIQNSLHIQFNISPKTGKKEASVYSDFEEFDNDVIQEWGNKKAVPFKIYGNKTTKIPSKTYKKKVSKVIEVSDSEEICHKRQKNGRKENTPNFTNAKKAESTKMPEAKSEKISEVKGNKLEEIKQVESTMKGQKMYHNKNSKKETEAAQKKGRLKKLEVLRNKGDKNESIVNKLAAMWDESFDNLPELVVEKTSLIEPPPCISTPLFLKEKYLPPKTTAVEKVVMLSPKLPDQSLENPRNTLEQVNEDLPAITSPFSSSESTQPTTSEQQKPVKQPKTHIKKHKDCDATVEQASQQVAFTSPFSSSELHKCSSTSELKAAVTSPLEQLRCGSEQALLNTSKQQKPVNQPKTYMNKRVQAPKQNAVLTKNDSKVDQPNVVEMELEKLVQQANKKTKDIHNKEMHKIFFGDTNESNASKITQRKPRKQVRQPELLQTDILSSQESVWALPKAAKGGKKLEQPIKLKTKRQAVEDKFDAEPKQSEKKIVLKTVVNKKAARNKTSGKLQNLDMYSEKTQGSSPIKDKAPTVNLAKKTKKAEKNNETLIFTQNNAVKASGYLNINKEKSPEVTSAISVKSVPTPLTIPESPSIESSPFFVEGTPMETVTNCQSSESAMKDRLNKTIVPEKPAYLKQSLKSDASSSKQSKRLSQVDIAGALAEPLSSESSSSSSSDHDWEPVKQSKKIPAKRLYKKRPRPASPQTSSDSEEEMSNYKLERRQAVLPSKMAGCKTASRKKESVRNLSQVGKKTGSRSNSTALGELEDDLHKDDKKPCLDISLSPIMSDVDSDCKTAEEDFEQWPVQKLLNARSLTKNVQHSAYLEMLTKLVQDWTVDVTHTAFNKRRELMERFSSMLDQEIERGEKRVAELENLQVRQEKALRYIMSTFEMLRENLEQQLQSDEVVRCQTGRLQRRLDRVTQEATGQKVQLAEKVRLLREEHQQQDSQRMLRNIRAKLNFILQ